ncbi:MULTISPECIES: four helix bundle protein [unclassified Flavobacterium]|uniref:four helix bundle protein n=1 Tax=unclassified Flavobacterium TaxID=196869 RepID=UPI0012A96A1F|nr:MULTISPECIES: four helix bundle protein [unclassified Flavobacterium]MBF4486158.1 four helix bundle protein [Flavobacterium sp. CSZ]QGK76521.1 four helix bundle protein [Flavobacterium sp. SLB02]
MVIYQLAREQCNQVWNLIITTSLGQDYKLREQINGSSGSGIDNIAEGFGRGGNKEFITFLVYSRGSCCETKAQLQRCFDRKHIREEVFLELNLKAQNTIDQISKFMNYLKTSDRKGSKYD